MGKTLGVSLCSSGDPLAAADVLLTALGVQNVALPLANTAYQITLTAGAKNFSLQTREGGAIRMATSSANTDTEYFTIRAGQAYNIEGVEAGAALSFWVKSTSANQTLEILYWL